MRGVVSLILNRPEQRVNVCVRAVILHRGHLLVTRLVDGRSFLVGGRVEHGESLLDTLHREVAEEVGRRVIRYRLLFSNENFFEADGGLQYHEFGWFFLVELDSPVMEPGQVLPHPDAADLRLDYIPLDDLPRAAIMPAFLATVLPALLAAEPLPPHHIVSRSQGGDHSHSIADLIGA